MKYMLRKRKEREKVTIKDKPIKEILIMSDDNELIASITDSDVIEKDGYKVICVPEND